MQTLQFKPNFGSSEGTRPVSDQLSCGHHSLITLSQSNPRGQQPSQSQPNVRNDRAASASAQPQTGYSSQQKEQTWAQYNTAWTDLQKKFGEHATFLGSDVPMPLLQRSVYGRLNTHDAEDVKSFEAHIIHFVRLKAPDRKKAFKDMMMKYHPDQWAKHLNQFKGSSEEKAQLVGFCKIANQCASAKFRLSLEELKKL